MTTPAIHELSPGPMGLEDFQHLLDHPHIQVQLSEEARQRIVECRDYLDRRLATEDKAIYGINTGFGYLRNTRIDPAQQEALQENLIRSHSCGMGEEVPADVVRLMLLLKVKSLSYGHSGIRLATVQRLLDLYNAGVCPVVYTQGSLGASGDLAPLAHLCLPLIGAGEADYQGRRWQGAELLAELGWEPLKLGSKEGLALLNGTQFMLAYGLYLLIRGKQMVRTADQVAAMSLDGFDGRLDPFSPLLHQIRAHEGQVATAAHFRELLADSEIIAGEKTDVQDPYSFRCVPQVHGASRDTLAHCERVFLTEANSTTDNPNIFVEADEILSGGNFHGQPLALALDFLAIALAELGSISERRVYLMMSGVRGLPAFLVANPGLNSGLMIAQYTAAGIVSRNKQHCTPASIDTIPSSNGQEDHVSMGANAAVKCMEVLRNVESLLGIELMTASQALWFREPHQTGSALREILSAYRQEVPPVEVDRILSEDMRRSADFVRGHMAKLSSQF